MENSLETDVPGIFAGGNVVHVHDLVDYVSWEAEKAGASAATYIQNKKKQAGRKIRLKAGENVKYILPHIISGEKEVTMYARVKEPRQKVRLEIEGVWSKSAMAVKPGEMIKIELSSRELDKISKDARELTLSCMTRG